MYIYLVFSKTGTWLSKILKIAVRSKYVHCSIAFEKALRPMYSFGRLRPANPFLAGFVEERFDRGVFQRYKECECRVYRLEVTPEQYARMQSAVQEFSKGAKTYKYNFWGLFAAKANVCWNRDGRYFCSQFVAEILGRGGLSGKGKAPAVTQPKDLMHDYGAEKIFEGYTDDYAGFIKNF